MKNDGVCLSVGNFAKYMKEIMDPECWGTEKKFVYQKHSVYNNMLHSDQLYQEYLVFQNKIKNESDDKVREKLEANFKYTKKLLGKHYNKYKLRLYRKKVKNDDGIIGFDDDVPCFENHIYNFDPCKFLYYTCRSSADIIMPCIDVDAGEWLERVDADIIAKDIVDRFHPGAYYEPSSNKLGRHIYFYLNVNMVPRVRVNELLSKYSEALGYYYNNIEDYFSHVDGVKATITTLKQNGKFGTLCKMPCPLNDERFNELKGMPVFTIHNIESNLELLKSEIVEYYRCNEVELSLREIEIAIDKTANKRSKKKCLTMLLEQKKNMLNNIIGDDNSVKDIEKLTCNIETVRTSVENKLEYISTIIDRLSRRREFYFYLSCEYGYVPEPHIAEAEYVNAGLSNSGSSKKRIDKFASIYTYMLDYFKPGKISGGKVKEIEDILSDIIDPGELYYSKGKGRNDSPIDIIDLAVMINHIYYYHDNACHFSYETMVGLMKDVYGLKSDKNKVSAIIKILKNHNIISVTRNYIPGVRGNAYEVNSAVLGLDADDLAAA